MKEVLYLKDNICYKLYFISEDILLTQNTKIIDLLILIKDLPYFKKQTKEFKESFSQLVDNLILKYANIVNLDKSDKYFLKKNLRLKEIYTNEEYKNFSQNKKKNINKSIQNHKLNIDLNLCKNFISLQNDIRNDLIEIQKLLKKLNIKNISSKIDAKHNSNGKYSFDLIINEQTFHIANSYYQEYDVTKYLIKILKEQNDNDIISFVNNIISKNNLVKSNLILDSNLLINNISSNFDLEPLNTLNNRQMLIKYDPKNYPYYFYQSVVGYPNNYKLKNVDSPNEATILDNITVEYLKIILKNKAEIYYFIDLKLSFDGYSNKNDNQDNTLKSLIEKTKLKENLDYQKKQINKNINNKKFKL